MAEKKADASAPPREEVLAEAVAPAASGALAVEVPFVSVKSDAKAELKAEDKGKGGDQGVDSDLHVNVEVSAALSVERDLLLSSAGRLESWASLLPQTECELLAELGGGYLFFFSGDGLLLHLLRKSHLDLDLFNGFQSLRFVYQAERLLDRIQRAGAHFRLVFFRVFENTNANGVFRLMVASLRFHLSLRGVPFLLFDDWFDPRFSASVDELHPLFFLLSDLHFPALEEELVLSSEALETCDEKSVSPKSDAWAVAEGAPISSAFYQFLTKKSMVRSEGRLVSFLLQSLMLRCCSLSLDLAFLRDLVVKSTKVFAPSASCYAGANLWRAMELRLQKPEATQQRVDGASTRADAVSEEMLLQELEKNLAEAPSPLDAVFIEHSAMLQEVFGERDLFGAKQSVDASDLLADLSSLIAKLEEASEAEGDFASFSLRLLFVQRFLSSRPADARTGLLGKLLVLCFFFQNKLGLQERARGNALWNSLRRRGEGFEADFLRPGIVAFLESATETLRVLGQRLEGAELDRRSDEALSLLFAGSAAVPDMFDAKLFASLATLAGECGRSAGSWKLDAETVGLDAREASLLEASWKGVCASLPRNAAFCFSEKFFPLSVELLREWIPSDGAALEEARATSALEADCSSNVLALSSSFLRRLRAGGPRAGELPGVAVLEDAEEEKAVSEKELRAALRVEQRREKALRMSKGLDISEEEEFSQDGDSEDEDSGELDRYKLELLLEVRNAIFDARADASMPSTKDPPSEVLFECLSTDDLRTPSKADMQRMENMNCEQRKKYWEARLRRRAQQNLRNVARIAKSICPHPLHFPIVSLQSNHPWKTLGEDEKSEPKGKGGKTGKAWAGQTTKGKAKAQAPKKADLIRMKNCQEKEKRIKDVDSERSENIIKLLSALCDEHTRLSAKSSFISSFRFQQRLVAVSPSELHSLLLEALVGSGRRMDLLTGLPAITRALKTKERQKELAMEIHTLANDGFREMPAQSCSSDVLPFDAARDVCERSAVFLEMRKLLCLLFRLNVEIARLFLSELKGNEIEAIQRSFLSMGFKVSAKVTFEDWKKAQLQRADAEGGGTTSVRGKSSSKKGPAVCLSEQLEVHRVESAVPFEFCIAPDSEAEVQLRFMGGDFERSTRAAGLPPDSRVLFTPDSWQSRLLDAVDSYASAFVAAPTASGKTFVCYYAMELALRASHDAVVVYVCPNKALAQQVFAEIYGRFGGKAYPVNCHKVLSSQILYKACTAKALSAQVVVTVPYYMELMLLSGHPEFREFVSHIKYVVLDEVHCIAEKKEGHKWERLIQMLPCPFLAMSATVGNAESFIAWMRRSAPERDIRFVTHKERFSDLHIHVYDQKRVVPLHPMACVHFSKVIEEGLADDFYLPPVDGLHLYQSLCRLLPPTHYFRFIFDPKEYFNGTAAITKKQYRFYWHSMRTVFVDLIRETQEIKLEDFARLQEMLQDEMPSWKDDLRLFAPLKGLSSPDDSEVVSARYKGSLERLRTRDVFTKSYLDPEEQVALRDLRNTQVRRMGTSLSKLLTSLQWQKYYGTPEAAHRTKMLNKLRMEEYQALLLEREQAKRMRGMSRQQREEQGLDKQDLASLELTDDVPPPPGDIAEEIDEEFSFANPKAMGTNFDDIRELLADVKYRANTAEDELLLNLLWRGVGLFDDGLSKTYRVAVELLYRWGFLRIIICTHALALGMNLPCKAAVFAGDALVLTPTMFKQAGGRAGRRGFDPSGHVIFWEVPFRRISRLLEARLPVFSGDFPVTPMLGKSPHFFVAASSLCLLAKCHVNESWKKEKVSFFRLLSVLRTLRLNRQLGQEGALDAVVEDCLNRLFLNPLFSVSGSNFVPSEEDLQRLRFLIRYSVRFTADLLVRVGAIARLSEEGDCAVNACGTLAELLFESGSGALLWGFLVSSGVVDAALDIPGISQSERLSVVLQLLSLCCGRLPVYSNAHLQKVVQNRLAVARWRALEAGGSREFANAFRFDARPCMELPSLPIEGVIEAFNRAAIKSTVDSVVSASAVIHKRVGMSREEFALPYSKMQFEATTSLSASDDSVLGKLVSAGEESAAQSPFEALAGRQDSFAGWTLEELEDALRRDVVLQSDVSCAAVDLRIFEVAKFEPHNGGANVWRLSSLNCYLQDIFAHGKLVRAVKETGVAPENLWYLLLHFVSSIDYIRRGLCNVNPDKEGSPLEAALNAVGDRMTEVFKHQSA